ncbi:hypothetical protein [Acidisoma cladoniae]|uniref:hypothetical protein n=1 Tax=Acidisoma cladoniae TaxID=3040935 RepID=UPI00254E8A90|nr:hypothetical protein [Acidisoma sp. PAMC 29798]
MSGSETNSKKRGRRPLGDAAMSPAQRKTASRNGGRATSESINRAILDIFKDRLERYYNGLDEKAADVDSIFGELLAKFEDSDGRLRVANFLIPVLRLNPEEGCDGRPDGDMVLSLSARRVLGLPKTW